MKQLILSLLLITLLTVNVFPQRNRPSVEKANQPLYKNPQADVESRIEDLMKLMTIEEKVTLLIPNHFSTKSIERLGIPQILFINGSYGCRGDRSTSFSTAVNFAATWNPVLINSVGKAFAQEVKSNGRNMLLGPVISIHRIPQAGRNAESYSEDPYLAGTMATTLIKGLQSQNVPATAAFFGPKTQEYRTHSYDANISERALHEIYYPPYRMAVQEGNVMGIMTPYNRINGVHAANNKPYLWDLLKQKWGYQGLVMTDWAGVQNFQEAIIAGLDLDTPYGRAYTKEKLTQIYEQQYKSYYSGVKELLADRLDETVRRILRVMFSNGFFEPGEPIIGFDTITHRALSLQVAHESITLLKNEDNILPLVKNKIKSLAIIGPNADECRHSIYWASRVYPYIETTPLQGILSKVGSDVVIRFSQGCSIHDQGKFLDSGEVIAPDGRRGFLLDYYDNLTATGEPVFSELLPSVRIQWVSNPLHPPFEHGEFSVRARGTWIPSKSGYYRLFKVQVQIYDESIHEVDLKIESNGRKVIRDKGLEYHYFEKGKSYPVEYTFNNGNPNGDLRNGGHFEINYKYYEEDALQNAVEAARNSDVAVLFLGFSEVLEREVLDRSPALPDNQIELFHAVAAVNPNIVVVLNTGSGVSIQPWGDKAKGIIQAFYPGQEGGTALADILFGDVNPSGKLPVTMMNKWEDSPVYGYYPHGADDILHYVEGIYVGYRYFDRQDTPDAAFPFGHGLSYTTFSYSMLKVTPDVTSTGYVTATINIKNTGERAGAEVVQLYIGDDVASVDRPVKELKAYKKVFLKPGESNTIQFEIKPEDLKFFDMNENDWKAEPGVFTVFVGSSSKDIRQVGKFKLAL